MNSCLLAISCSDHTAVISYFYPYMLQYMDADGVTHMMHCEHLLTDDNYEAITTAPNDWIMNVLILEYIRVMDRPTLLKFVGLLKTMETQESIGCNLESGMYIHN